MITTSSDGTQQASLQLLIYKFSNTEFYPIGELDVYQNAFFSVNYQGGGRFEFFSPILPQTTELLKIGNLIWTGGDYAYLIESIRSSVTSTGALMYHVTGRSLASLLTQRIVIGMYTAKNRRASSIMYDLVNRNAITTSDSNRKMPYLSNTADKSLGDIVSIQHTGGLIYDHIDKLAKEQELGYRIKVDPRTKKIMFDVYKGVDRTANQTKVPVVEFASDLDDIFESEHYLNHSDYKNWGSVAGEGEGRNRVTILVGDSSAAGFRRHEMYVDARDLQSDTQDENGNSIILDFGAYATILGQRGREKLAQASITETVEASIRIYGNTMYKFGVDYQLGDTVTITDKRIGITMSAAISGMEETFGEEYKLNLLFGFSPMTFTDRIRNIT